MPNNFEFDTNEYLQQCDSKDVVNFESKQFFYLKELRSLVIESFQDLFKNSLANYMNRTISSKCKSHLWFSEGEECEILRAGSQGWEKGKIKLKMNITLEFIPDELEETKSPLDDVRQEINSGDR